MMDFPNRPTQNAYEKLVSSFTLENWKNFTLWFREDVEMRKAFVNNKDNFIKIGKLSRGTNYRLQGVPLPESSRRATDFIQVFFTSMVKYLGPLRDEPKAVYPLPGGNDPRDIGYKGEYTAAVLEINRNVTVRYIPSNKLNGFDKNADDSFIETDLSTAVQDWMYYMGIATSMETEDYGKLGHRLTVKTESNDIDHDLTHVGVGVSQILPILVQTLLADSGATLIFEQPELHLHPKVQSRLADFFLSMTYLNKQCIIETHSEYLINRLRFLIALSEQKDIGSNVALYFAVRKDRSSSYNRININEYGSIVDWPEGFFDESEDNAALIIKASIDKRNKMAKINKELGE